MHCTTSATFSTFSRADVDELLLQVKHMQRTGTMQQRQLLHYALLMGQTLFELTTYGLSKMQHKWLMPCKQHALKFQCDFAEIVV